MSLEQSAARERDGSYTINEWCDLHGLSRATFYRFPPGAGPDTFDVGSHKRISARANREWVKKCERAARSAKKTTAA